MIIFHPFCTPSRFFFFFPLTPFFCCSHVATARTAVSMSAQSYETPAGGSGRPIGNTISGTIGSIISGTRVSLMVLPMVLLTEWPAAVQG